MKVILSESLNDLASTLQTTFLHRSGIPSWQQGHNYTFLITLGENHSLFGTIIILASKEQVRPQIPGKATVGEQKDKFSLSINICISFIVFTHIYPERGAFTAAVQSIPEWKARGIQSCHTLLTEIKLLRIMRGGHSVYLKWQRESRHAKYKNLLQAGIWPATKFLIPCRRC